VVLFDLYLVTDEHVYVFRRLFPLGRSPCGFFGGYQHVKVEYIVTILRAEYFFNIFVFLYFLLSSKLIFKLLIRSKTM